MWFLQLAKIKNQHVKKIIIVVIWFIEHSIMDYRMLLHKHRDEWIRGQVRQGLGGRGQGAEAKVCSRGKNLDG